MECVLILQDPNEAIILSINSEELPCKFSPAFTRSSMGAFYKKLCNGKMCLICAYKRPVTLVFSGFQCVLLKLKQSLRNFRKKSILTFISNYCILAIKYPLCVVVSHALYCFLSYISVFVRLIGTCSRVFTESNNKVLSD